MRGIVTDWLTTESQLRVIAKSQIFFVGGPPRSGTTWLQQIIDQHPQASCRGEGLFAKHLFPHLQTCLDRRREALEAKNRVVFGHTTGYPLPSAEDGQFLAATAILLALHQQAAGRDCLAYGEKTPENVFDFPKFKRLFPQAKLIAIARDPRDLMTSAWHFFYKNPDDKQNDDAKMAFLRVALPSINDGMRAMLHHRHTDPDACCLVTYEQLQREPQRAVAAIFRFLGLDAGDAIVSACLEATRFETMTGGRKPGDGADGSFLRKGVVGDWQSTLSPAMNSLIVQELGWAFPTFGWTP